VDVGANIGFITLVMARQVGREGQVVAIQPSEWAFEHLAANLALNDMPNVTLVAMGLSDADGVSPPADIPVGYRLDGRIVTRRQEVRFTTLDTYLAANPVQRLDFIKCDTDGFEPQVLAGAERMLRRFGPALHIELYQGTPSDRRETAERLLAFLEGLGYAFQAEGTLARFDGAAAVLSACLPGVRAANVVALKGASALSVSSEVRGACRAGSDQTDSSGRMVVLRNGPRLWEAGLPRQSPDEVAARDDAGDGAVAQY